MKTEHDLFMESTLPVESEYSSAAYRQILQQFPVSLVENGKYLKVNQRQHKDGWVFYISVVVTEVESLIRRIVPYLVDRHLSFDVAKSPAVVRALSAGFFGHEMIGKIVVIYPDAVSVADLAPALCELTEGVKGSIIPTAFQLKGVVHANFAAGDIEITEHEQNTAVNSDYTTTGQNNLVKRQLAWPFGTITPPVVRKSPKIIARRYLIDKTLKNDAKGRVLKVLDLKTLRFCVIKEGIRYMSYDYAGRDVTDRLRWQFEMHNTLHRIISAPGARDLFEEAGNWYLVIDFKKGIPFSQFIDEIYANRHCAALSSDKWERLINGLKSILTQLSKLHSNGYIFRDVNPRNFLIDNSGAITCIDFELTYQGETGKPSPPFELGTPGYMSPEQEAGAHPTIHQDIYGVGGLMIRCLTGLSPMVFDLSDVDALCCQLNFHMGPQQANLVSQCFSFTTEERPPLPNIIASLDTWPNNYFNPKLFELGVPDRNQIRSTVQDAIKGLANPKLLNQEHLWVSKSFNTDKNLSNEVVQTDIKDNLYDGIGGIIYLLMDAKSLGFDLTPCKGILEANFNHVFNNYINGAFSGNDGLFHGKQGITLLALKALKLEWTSPIPGILSAIRKSTEQQFANNSLSSGTTGLGLALIEISKYVKEDWPGNILNAITDELIEKQCKNGSWKIYTRIGTNSKNIDIGFFTGISGIIYFLFKVYEYSQHTLILSSAMKGLNYLIRHERQLFGEASKLWGGSGSAGVAIPFIQGYAITGDLLLQRQIDKLLRRIPHRINSPHLGFSDGITGMGEVYLQAHKVLGIEEWKERADWITNYILHRAIRDPTGGLHWATDTSGLFSAGLMSGNGAVIHYLLKYLEPNELNFPIF
ncbi:lanthionine synthetase LanC family protein [Chitinophaga sp. S165]|uniref:lanthionine synthetase LanC family protein n=1 Tax=Chitinophaga sp. S165 TaxID=2135462 RepID=UPI000D71C940|nr:lanthionine synthetase LanC family protein [Chitinophaga sp. S165]PWV47079.1 lanthionine synthetase-like protein [Chitinophaga sp. S165]